jgi:ketosteroid isomerase-like protein
MSHENVQFVRNVYATLDRGDAESWDLLPPDFVFDFSQRLTDPVILRRDPARAEYDRMRHEIFEEGRVGWQPKELIDAGDKVLAFIETSGRGKSGGVVFSAHSWSVWTFRDGKPVEWTYFGHHRWEALEAAGLSG